jgi:hypothetical protein
MRTIAILLYELPHEWSVTQWRGRTRAADKVPLQIGEWASWTGNADSPRRKALRIQGSATGAIGWHGQADDPVPLKFLVFRWD